MKLGEWLQLNGRSRADFARVIGVEVESVTRYVNGDRVPRPLIMGKIKTETDGMVTADDFMSTQTAAAE